MIEGSTVTEAANTSPQSRISEPFSERKATANCHLTCIIDQDQCIKKFIPSIDKA